MTQLFSNLPGRLLTILIGLTLPVPVSAQTPPVPVALSGHAAPTGGGNYSTFYTPQLNATGDVAFRADLSGGTSGGGIFAGQPGFLQTVVLRNTPAPVFGNFNLIGNFVLNDNGAVAFRIGLVGTSGGSAGIFLRMPSSTPTTVVLQGTSAGGGATYGVGDPKLNSVDKVAFETPLSGGSHSSGIFFGQGSPLTSIALANTLTPAGDTLTGFDPPTVNTPGLVAFQASLTGASTSGIFVRDTLNLGAPLITAALAGTAAPAGGNYSGTFSQPVLNDLGHIAFRASLTGGTSTTGIFAGAAGFPLATIALQGSAAPAGGNYTGFGTPRLNTAGQVAFAANLSGLATPRGIFVGTPGSGVSTIAVAGTTSPDGIGIYSTINTNIAFNAAGQVAFLSSLTGQGVTAASDNGLFAGAPGAVVKIVREGDVIDIDPGELIVNRTVSGILFQTGSGGEDGNAMGLNDSGQLAYRLTFTDGSSGIFTSFIAPVPEPSAILLGTGAAHLLAVGVRRCRARRRAKKRGHSRMAQS